MKQIVIRKTDSGRIITVSTVEKMMKYHRRSYDAIVNAVKKDKEWELKEVDDDVYNAFKFLLGEKEYRGTYTIESIYDNLNDNYCALERVKQSLGNCSTIIEDIKTLVEELKENEK